jgi:protein-S-isoprenylcysteine O-methyltransferase Ste14
VFGTILLLETFTQSYFGAFTIFLMMSLVVVRVILLKHRGIEAMKFGQLDKTDFLIPPFMLFYFYLVFAHAFGWPTIIIQKIFHSETVSWIGVLFCLAGLLLLLWSLVSFGQSFRVGIDTEHPDSLVTTGVFSHCRNPIYVAFIAIFLGEFLIFSNWIFLVYLFAAAWLIHRQVLREEDYLKIHYGEDYLAYCDQVSRYF